MLCHRTLSTDGGRTRRASSSSLSVRLRLPSFLLACSAPSCQAGYPTSQIHPTGIFCLTAALRKLQDIVVVHMINGYCDYRSVLLRTKPLHPFYWFTASPDMPRILRKHAIRTCTGYTSGAFLTGTLSCAALASRPNAASLLSTAASLCSTSLL